MMPITAIKIQMQDVVSKKENVIPKQRCINIL